MFMKQICNVFSVGMRREGGRRATAKPSGRSRRSEILLHIASKGHFALRGDQRAFRSPFGNLRMPILYGKKQMLSP